MSYASWALPLRVSATPVAIIAAPVPSATSNAARPTRNATRMLGESAPTPTTAAAAKPTATMMISPPPAANVIDTMVSKPVSKLKWDGTPRQACMLTSAVSTTLAPVNRPSSNVRTRGRTVRYDVAQATEASVSPNDSPNVAALRSDSGPSHDPPVTTSTPTWTSPLANSTPPTM